MLAVAHTAWAALAVCGGAILAPVGLMGWAAWILADQDQKSEGDEPSD